MIVKLDHSSLHQNCHSTVSTDSNWYIHQIQVTRLGVTIRDYIDTHKYQDDRSVFQVGQRRDKPTQSQLDDLEAGPVLL